MDDHSRIQFRVAQEGDASRISAVARDIWTSVYPGIISPEQIEYMLRRMYAIPVLQEEMHAEGIRFVLAESEGELVGFSSLGPTERPDTAKIHKLYLSPGFHGKGEGSRLLKATETLARSSGFEHVMLQVNKNNQQGIQAYRRNGYNLLNEVVDDIGCGFVMDDYVFGKAL